MTAENLAAVVHSIVPSDVQAKYPNSGARGYCFPTCLYCPSVDYTSEALNRKISGTVELGGIVGEDGQLHDVQVLTPLPFGLTRAAIAGVTKWCLKPATGPDGKPAAARRIHEVSVQSYRGCESLCRIEASLRPWGRVRDCGARGSAWRC